MSRAERHAITVELDAWARGELEREARAREMSVEELAAYAVSYYLADADSGRLARRSAPPGRGQPPSA